MSDKLISDLPLATSVEDADLFEMEQGGVSKRVTADLLPGTGGGGSGNDENDNYSANNFLSGYTTTTTAGTTTTLTISSTYQQYFTGTTTQACVLPVASTLVLGHRFFIANTSTGDVTVQSSGLNEVIILAENESAMVTCILTSGTTGASWSAVSSTGGGGGGTGTVDTIGIPVANQIGIWTDVNTLKGTTGLTVDANSNLFSNNVNSAYRTTATAASTTTLTVASEGQQYFTGSTTQTVVLPVTSTLTLGHQFYIYNASSDDVTVQSSGLAEIAVLAPDTALLATCILTSGTGAASWNAVATPEIGTVAVGDVTGLGANVATALGNDANAAGGFATINGVATLTNKTIALGDNTVQVYTASYAANQTLTTAECYGGVIYVTAAATMTLPAVAAGMSVTVITIGAIAVSVDPNTTQVLRLDGTALTGGNKATNTSTSGDIITLTYYAAGVWYAASNAWTDGG